MAQIVEMEVDQLSALYGALPGRTEVIPAPGSEDQTGVLRAAPGEHGVRPAVQRHLAPPLALGAGAVEQDDPLALARRIAVRHRCHLLRVTPARLAV